MENGYPEIILIPVIAELLSISTDYLLTGREHESEHTEASQGGEKPSATSLESAPPTGRTLCRLGIRHLLLSAVAGALIAVLLVLTFTLFIPLLRHKRAADAFADGRLSEAREVYSSTGGAPRRLRICRGA